MAKDGEAQAYLADLGPKIRTLASDLHNVLLELGCMSYVKTVYIGYDINGEMVAALYGRSSHVEIALALSEDADDTLLVDARHLTWRTLPVAAIVRNTDDVTKFAHLATIAVDRVQTASHEVNRDNEFFMKSRREKRKR